MALVRYTRLSGSSSGERASVGYEEKRQSIRSNRLGVGTLACSRCDAPIAIGGEPVSVTTPLTCPFCGTHGQLRDFLSMAAPSRPARVVVRVSARRTLRS